MAKFRKIGLLAAPALALMALSGCATTFNADVARFQELPAPQGQSFAVVADDPKLAGGLEFAQYAGVVSSRLSQIGYVPAADPASANLIVRVAYAVDTGREKVRSTGFGGGFGGWSGWGGGYGGWGRGGYGFGRGGFYGGRRFGYGFYDPFLFGPGFNDITSYTVFTSKLEMRIDRAGDGKRLFEGTASAQSLSNKLTYLVPNLIDAMFTNFPGQSGENVKITVAPEPK